VASVWSQNVTALVSGAVPYAAIGTVAVQGLKHAGKNTTTTNTASGDGAATGGTASLHTEQIGPNSQNSPTTNTTSTTDNSNQGNATATPTVVTQPAPVVVPQPAPVIVTQPAPIVVDP
jgi:hypothetical protein